MNRGFQGWRWFWLGWIVLLLVVAVRAALALAQPPAWHELRDARARLAAAGSYRLHGEIAQVLLPRALPTMRGQQEQRQTMQIDGDIVLPDDAYLRLTIGSEPNSQPLVIVVRDGQPFVPEQGRFVPAPEPGFGASGAIQLLEFLDAAKDVQITTGTGAAAGKHYTFRLDPARLAQQMRKQLEAQAQPAAGRGRLPALRVPPQLAGSGQLWVDERGYPLRQLIEAQIPEASGEYDAEMRLDVHFEAIGEVRELPQVVADGDGGWRLERIAVAAPGGLLSVEGVDRWLIGVSGPALRLFGLLMCALGLALLVVLARRWRRRAMVLASLLMVPLLIVEPALPPGDLGGQRAQAAEAAEQRQQIQRAEQAAAQALRQQSTLPSDTTAIPDGCGSGSPTNDADDDLLSDFVERCLGTHPDLADSDGDGVSDGIEQRGLSWNGQTWRSDAQNADSNSDGIADGFEWPAPAGTAVVTDTNNNGVPDLWDPDNDGDDVPDNLDLSPQTSGLYVNSFDLQLAAARPFDGATYVELQLRPQNPDHLRYHLSTLDWPLDSEGQITDIDSTVDDLRLIPVLLISTTQTSSLAEQYGVLSQLDENNRVESLLVPLAPIEQHGAISAFYAKVAFPQTEANQLNWRVRLAWVVEAQIDSQTCVTPETPFPVWIQDNEVCSPLTTKASAVQLYSENRFQVVGLSVTRSRQVEAALFGAPARPDEDATLARLLFGLNMTFLAGSAISGQAPQRSMLEEFAARFGNAATPVEQRFGITDTIVVEHGRYGHSDEAVADISGNRAQQLLATHYQNVPAGQGCAGASEAAPCAALVTAMEQQVAAVGLDDLVRSGTPVTHSLGIDLDQTLAQLTTMRTVQLVHYLWRENKWQALSLPEVMELVTRRYDFDALEAEASSSELNATADSLRFWTYSFYLTWSSGRTIFTNYAGELLVEGSIDEQSVYDTIKLNSAALTGRLALSRLPFAISGIIRGIQGIGDASGKFVTFVYTVEGTTLSVTFSALGTLQVVTGITRIAASLASIASTAAALAAFICQADAYDGENATDCDADAVKSASTIIGTTGRLLSLLTEILSATTRLVEGKKLVEVFFDAPSSWTKLIASADKFAKSFPRFTAYAKVAAKVVGVVGLLVDLALIWAVFGLAATAATTAFEYTSALANAIISTFLSVASFFLGFLPYGGLIVAVVLAIYALLSFIPGVSDAVAAFIAKAEPVTELSGLELVDPQLELTDPERGLVAGNSLTYSDRFRTTFTIHDGWPSFETSARGYFRFAPFEHLTVPAEVSITNGEATCVSYDGNRPVIDDYNEDADSKVCENAASVRVRFRDAEPNLTVRVHWWLGYYYYYLERYFGAQQYQATKEYDTYPTSDAEDGAAPPLADMDSFDLVFDVLPASIGELWNWTALTNHDPDGDGLLSSLERVLYLTASDNWDSDGDGLSDSFELGLDRTSLAAVQGLRPTSIDSDQDGVADGEELRIGTNPANPDSDGDGLADGREVPLVRNGRIINEWKVRLPDGSSVFVFANPLNADADGDGLNDRSELENGFSPFVPNQLPRLQVAVEPRLVNPAGQAGSYAAAGQSITTTLLLANTSSQVVTSTLDFCLAGSLALEGTPRVVRVRGSDQRPGPEVLITTSVACPQPAQLLKWPLASAGLAYGEILSVTVAARVSGQISTATTLPLTATLPLATGAPTEALTAVGLLQIDVSPPEIQIASPPPDSILRGEYYVLGGTTSDDYGWVREVQLTLPGAAASITTTLNPWTSRWKLPGDGVHTITATAIDMQGRPSLPATTTVVVDNTAPTVTIDLVDTMVLPAADPATGIVTLTGSAGDNLSGLVRVEISVDGGPWRPVELVASGAGPVAWRYGFRGPADVNKRMRLALRAYDQAGNLSPLLQRQVLVDSTPPENRVSGLEADQATFAIVRADSALPVRGYADDGGDTPQPTYPRSRLEGMLDPLRAATVWLELPDSRDGVTVTTQWAGDLNGDGKGDLLIGTPEANAGAGRVTVVYGQGSGWALPPAAYQMAASSSSFSGGASARTGSLFSPAGDVNGDGLSDILIGDPLRQRVFLVYGRPAPWGRDLLLDNERPASWSILSLATTPAATPVALQAAGDVNGDGLDDILIVARSGSGEHRLYLVAGQRNALPASLDLARNAAATMVLPGPAIVSGVGDVDGDRVDDFAVAVGSNPDRTSLGVSLFKGSRSLVLPVVGAPQTLALSSRSAFFGLNGPTPRLAALGDLNGDGLADFVYGADGQPRIVLGRRSGPWQDSLVLDSYGVTFHGFLAAPGDVNGDGFNDLLIGGTANQQLNAYLLFGSSALPAKPPIAATFGGVASAASTPYAAGADLNCDASSDLLLIPLGIAEGDLLPADLDPLTLPASNADPLPKVVSRPTNPGGTGAVGASTPPALPPGAPRISRWLYVDDDPCAGCYESMAKALAAATNNTQIIIRPGVYKPFILTATTSLRRDLAVTGVNPDSVIIEGSGDDAAGIQVNNLQGVVISGLTIRNSAVGVSVNNAGVGGSERSADQIILDRLLIQDFSRHGLALSRNSSVDTRRSTFVGKSGSGEYLAIDTQPAPQEVARWGSSFALPASLGNGGGIAHNDDSLYAVLGASSNGGRRFVRYTPGQPWKDLPALPIMGTGTAVANERLSNLATGGDNLYVLRDSSNWSGGVDIDVRAIVVDGEQIYIGGKFEFVRNPDGSIVRARNVAHWNGTSWQPLAGGVDGVVNALVLREVTSGVKQLVVGGEFSGAVDGDQRHVPYTANLAIWLLNPGAWGGLGDFNAGVQAVGVDENANLYLAGAFTRLIQRDGSVLETRRIVRVLNNLNGSLTIETLGADFQAAVRTLYVHKSLQGGTVVYAAVGCTLYRYDQTSWTRLHEWYNTNQSVCQINALAWHKNRLYVGGEGLQRDANVVGPFNNIAALRDDGGSVRYDATPLGGGVLGPVLALASYGDDLVVAGQFSQAQPAGSPVVPIRVERIALWRDDRWYTADISVNDPDGRLGVRALAADLGQGELYIGGDLSEITPTGGSELIINGLARRTNASTWSGIGRGVWSNPRYLYRVNLQRGTDWQALPAFLGRPGSLAALGSDQLYATESGGRIWEYQDGATAWEELPKLPAGGTVDAASALATDASQLYLLTGPNGKFYRFSPVERTWAALPDAPFTVGQGSSLIWDGADNIYAIPGGLSQRLYRYRLASGSWERLDDAPAPLDLGGNLALFENTLYAVHAGGAVLLPFGPLTMPRGQLRLSNLVFVPPAVGTPTWISPTLDSLAARTFTLLDQGGSRWVKDVRSWWPAISATQAISFEAARFLAPQLGVYRVQAGSALTDTGYYQFRLAAYVSPDYCSTCANDGLRWNQDAFNSVQAAIDSGAQRVILRPGHYAEAFALASGVEVIGAGADATIISGPSGLHDAALVSAAGISNAGLAGVTLAGSAGNAGLSITKNARAISLTRSIVRDGERGVLLRGAASDATLVNTTVVRNNIGVLVEECAQVSVRNSVFAWQRDVGLHYRGQNCSNGQQQRRYNNFWQNGRNLRADQPGLEVLQSGEIVADPRLSDPANNAFWPLRDSPLLGAGDPADPFLPGTGERRDIGYLQRGRAALYVDDSYGEGRVNDGLNWQVDAFDSIQDALNAAVQLQQQVCALTRPDADCPLITIGVGPGSYSEALTIPSRVRLLGSGADVTTLTAPHFSSTVSFSNSDAAELAGFTIIGRAGQPSAIRIDGASAISLTRLIVRESDVGVAVTAASQVSMTFTTLVKNSRAVVLAHSAARLSIANSIVASNTIGIDPGTGQLEARHNLFANPTNIQGRANDGENMYDRDPAFVDQARHDYRLQATSPAIDAAVAGVYSSSGDRADLGYREFRSIPLVLLPGREQQSCIVSGTGVAQVAVAAVPLASPTEPITATVPAPDDWQLMRLETPNAKSSWWDGSLALPGEGLYRIYARAADTSGNSSSVTHAFQGNIYAKRTAPQVSWLITPTMLISGTALELVAQVRDPIDVGGQRFFATESAAFEVVGTGYSATLPVTWDDAGWNAAAGTARIFRAWLPPTVEPITVTAIAIDRAGLVGRSQSRVLIPSDNQPPLAPPSGLSLEVQPDRVALAWQAPTDSRVDQIEIRRTVGTGSSTLLATLPPTQTGFVDVFTATGGISVTYRLQNVGNNNQRSSTRSAVAFQPATAGPTVEQDGFAAISAASYQQQRSVNAVSWQPISTGVAGAVAALPNRGLQLEAASLGVSPRLDYPVVFTNPGTYTVWAQLLAPDNASDSLHLGLNGQIQMSADRLTANRLGSWHWTNRTMDGVPATLVVTQTGVQTVSVWLREDGVQLGALQLVANNQLSTTDAPVQEHNGRVVLEAEQPQLRRAQGGWIWTSALISGTKGGALSAQPNVGGNYTGDLAGKPVLEYPIAFSQTGTYTVWVRMWAASGSDDSIHIGLDGVLAPDADQMTGTRLKTLHWSNRNRNGAVATLTITTPGMHRLSIWMREDGIVLDRIILSRDPRYTPSGAGPAASPRVP